MTRFVLFIVAIACMTIAAGMAGCGEDATPGSAKAPGSAGSEGEGEGSSEGEGEDTSGDPCPQFGYCHDGLECCDATMRCVQTAQAQEEECEVSKRPSTGGGEGEGEGARPPGADGEQCGGPSGNACQDGLECGAEAEEPGICTCPQWMEGRWWAEFDPRAVDYEYDFQLDRVDAAFWYGGEIELTQDGCSIMGPMGNYAIGWDDGVSSGTFNPPTTFEYKRDVGTRDGDAWITFTSIVAPDHTSVTGTCEGTYPDVSVLPHHFFRVECSFTLTRH